MTDQTGFPAGRAVVLDDRVRIWRDASVVLGGAPWSVLRITSTARPFLLRLKSAGRSGLTPSDALERALVDLLLARGIVHPVADPDGEHTSVLTPVDVVVPAYGRPDLLDACLTSVRSASPDARIVVVDDASPGGAVDRVARAHSAQVVRHRSNRGPAAARNSGAHATSSSIVAFVDSDCTVGAGWLDLLVAHFDDPRVGAVAPRILGRSESRRLLARYQRARSALDMGARPELVAPGAPLGYVPSATVLVRRSALGASGFDEDLRLGEDVDLVWRLVDEGWLVRYEPTVTVRHEPRLDPRGWLRRNFQYGTSAAALDFRHPGLLTPARLSVWNIALAALLLARRPSAPARAVGAAAVIAAAAARQARLLGRASVDPRVTAPVLGKSVVSDVLSVGHLLRREWWPLGWLALVAAARWRTGRAAAAAMLFPVFREWLTRRPDIDLPRYLGLRLAEDAAYGSGVIAGAVRQRQPNVVIPRVRMPSARRQPGAQCSQARLP